MNAANRWHVTATLVCRRRKHRRICWKRIAGLARCRGHEYRHYPTSSASDQPYRQALDDLRLERAFARIADSDLRHGNAIALLKDARENYPAWLDGDPLRRRRVVHFENFIIADDETGRAFARGPDGARPRRRDACGCSTTGSARPGAPCPPSGGACARPAWRCRVFNPPRLTDPFWIRRNHRKLITVDGTHRLRRGPVRLRQLERQRRAPSPGATRASPSKARWWRTSTPPSPRAGRSPA